MRAPARATATSPARCEGPREARGAPPDHGCPFLQLRSFRRKSQAVALSPIKRAFRASRSLAIAARSGSDAIILRSLRGTPLRRNSLILTITSPRTKLPNLGKKAPLTTGEQSPEAFPDCHILSSRPARHIRARRHKKRRGPWAE